jgi:hypothetical protein
VIFFCWALSLDLEHDLQLPALVEAGALWAGKKHYARVVAGKRLVLVQPVSRSLSGSFFPCRKMPDLEFGLRAGAGTHLSNHANLDDLCSLLLPQCNYLAEAFACFQFQAEYVQTYVDVV